MRVAAKACLLLAFGVAAGACGQADPGDSVDNAAVTEIEALPPDESAATPTNELVNGVAEPANAEFSQAQERSDR